MMASSAQAKKPFKRMRPPTANNSSHIGKYRSTLLQAWQRAASQPNEIIEEKPPHDKRTGRIACDLLLTNSDSRAWAVDSKAFHCYCRLTMIREITRMTRRL